VSRRSQHWCLALALLLALPGCYTMKFVVARVSEEQQTLPPIDVRNSFFFLGLGPTNDLDVRAVCPYGVWQIDENTTSVDVLLTFVTLLVYTPRTSSYYCRLAPPAAAPAPASPSP
jgi:Bor protein